MNYAARPMDLFMAICQGLGLALAVGIGGPLVGLFVGAMAALEAGMDPSGSSFEFVTATWFLVLMLLLVVVGILSRTREILRLPSLLAIGGIGAVVFAASLAEGGYAWWPGLIAGALVAVPAAIIANDILGGAIERAAGADPGTPAADAANMMIIVFVTTGIVLAGLSLFAPPASIPFAVAVAYLAITRRRKADEKYEGLRVLR